MYTYEAQKKKDSKKKKKGRGERGHLMVTILIGTGKEFIRKN